MSFLETLETQLAEITGVQETNSTEGDEIAEKVRQLDADRSKAYGELKVIRRSGFILQQQKAGLMTLIGLEKKKLDIS